MQPKRVMIVSSNVGGGHKAAARAITAAFAERYPSVEVRNVDILDLAPRPVAKIYAYVYTLMAGTIPSAWAATFEHTDRQPGPDMKTKKGPASATFLDPLIHRRFLKAVRSFDPDSIICTHFLPADVLGDCKRAGMIRAAISVVVTDYYMHGYWYCRGAERYFIATDEIKNQIVRVGFPAERVVVSGIPVHPEFAHPCSEAERARIVEWLGIEPGKLTLVIVAAGWRSEGIEEMVRAILTVGRAMNLVALVGRKKKVQARLTAGPWPDGVRGVAIGYTDRMFDVMKVSDVVVTKPGGLTTAECLAGGVAMIAVSPVPGQEAFNCDWLLENGAAVKAHSRVALAYKLDRLLADPSRLAALRDRARRIARPDAAFRIAEAICNRTEEENPCS